MVPFTPLHSFPSSQICLFLVSYFSDLSASSDSVAMTLGTSKEFNIWEIRGKKAIRPKGGNENVTLPKESRTASCSPPLASPAFPSLSLVSSWPRSGPLEGRLVNALVHVLAIWHPIWKLSSGFVVKDVQPEEWRERTRQHSANPGQRDVCFSTTKVYAKFLSGSDNNVLDKAINSLWKREWGRETSMSCVSSRWVSGSRTLRWLAQIQTIYNTEGRPSVSSSDRICKLKWYIAIK